MQFEISRTSQYPGEGKCPYEGAVHRGEIRTAVDGNKYVARWWALEVKDLGELLKIAEKEGELVVAAAGAYAKNSPSIEIYDGYRE